MIVKGQCLKCYLENENLYFQEIFTLHGPWLYLPMFIDNIKLSAYWDNYF